MIYKLWHRSSRSLQPLLRGGLNSIGWLLYYAVASDPEHVSFLGAKGPQWDGWENKIVGVTFICLRYYCCSGTWSTAGRARRSSFTRSLPLCKSDKLKKRFDYLGMWGYNILLSFLKCWSTEKCAILCPWVRITASWGARQCSKSKKAGILLSQIVFPLLFISIRTLV